MPLYEYRCRDCEEKFDKLVPYAQSHQQECPKCGSQNTEKLISSFATIGGSSSGGGYSYSGGGCGGSGGFT
ncbi:MAG: hypothetical protein Kow0037_20370 [Calditrichia bacterium]